MFLTHTNFRADQLLSWIGPPCSSSTVHAILILQLCSLKRGLRGLWKRHLVSTVTRVLTRISSPLVVSGAIWCWPMGKAEFSLWSLPLLAIAEVMSWSDRAQTDTFSMTVTSWEAAALETHLVHVRPGVHMK